MKEFRCPFEVKGEAEGLILRADLVADHGENRLRVFKKFKALNTNHRLMAIRCCLPASVKESCRDLDDLQKRILPYQLDLLVAEIEYRVSPFLPYQLIGKLKRRKRDSRDPKFRALYAKSLVAAMVDCGTALPQDGGDIASWIAHQFAKAREEGKETPSLQMYENETGLPLPTFKISLGGLTFEIDRARSMKDGKQNWNCFHIVKAPFYPRGFGRWSEDVEIVISREADINSVDAETRKKLRTLANSVHREHGVVIKSVAHDKQHTGLWIPEYQELLENFEAAH